MLGVGLETVGVEPDSRGVPVDAHLRAAEHLWAIGDVNGLWPLTHVGKYQGEVVAANILGEPRKANYEAVPRVVYTDPQAAAVGASAGRFSAMVPVSGVAKTATYTHAYAEQNGFLTLLSDGKRLTAHTRSAPRRASGCSRPRSRSAPTSHSTFWPTRSSRSRRFRRSTSSRSQGAPRPDRVSVQAGRYRRAGSELKASVCVPTGRYGPSVSAVRTARR